MNTQSELVAQLEAAERLRPAVLTARQRVAAAKKVLGNAARDHLAALSKLEVATRRLRDLESGRGSLLVKVAEVTLFEFWVELPSYCGPVRGVRAGLTQHGDVHQVSDVTGTTKSGVGGAVLGGLLLGPVGAVAGLAATRKNNVKTAVRTVDTRQFELEIQGPGFAWSTIKGPKDEDDLRKLRDILNARGSATDDIHALTVGQSDVVGRFTEAARVAESTNRSTSAVVEQEKGRYERAWASYSAKRPPILSDIRARWSRSGWLSRAVAIVGGPVILVAWTVLLAAAKVQPGPQSENGQSLILAATAVGLFQACALAALTVYYVQRVRLRK